MVHRHDGNCEQREEASTEAAWAADGLERFHVEAFTVVDEAASGGSSLWNSAPTPGDRRAQGRRDRDREGLLRSALLPSRARWLGVVRRIRSEPPRDEGEQRPSCEHVQVDRPGGQGTPVVAGEHHGEELRSADRPS